MHLTRAIDQLEPLLQWRLAVSWARRVPLEGRGAQVLRAADAVIDGRTGSLERLEELLAEHASDRMHQSWYFAARYVSRSASASRSAAPATRLVRVGQHAGMTADDMWATLIAAGARRYCDNPQTLDCAAALGPDWDGTLGSLYDTAHLLVEGRRGPCI